MPEDRGRRSEGRGRRSLTAKPEASQLIAGGKRSDTTGSQSNHMLHPGGMPAPPFNFPNFTFTNQPSTIVSKALLVTTFPSTVCTNV
jgi:hypothetical protein